MSLGRQFIRYVRYQRKAKSIFRIHSPFVYTLYHRVLKGKGMPSPPQELRSYLKGFLKNEEFVARKASGPGLERRRKIKDIARHESLSGHDAVMLYNLAGFLKPTHIIELGTCLGHSTASLALGAPGSQIISIDQDEQLQTLAREKSLSLGIKNISFRSGSFRALLPLALKEFEKTDLVFIDGDHEREETLYLVQMILPYLRRHGAILIHDIHHSSGMMEAWELAQGLPEITARVSTFSTGMLFISEGLSRESYRLRW